MIIIPEPKLIFIAFFLFGLLNNILYVIILSAAIDLVGSSTPKAVVLLADIVPSFSIKLTSAFFIHLIPYTTRMWILVGLSAVGMIVISLSPAHYVSIKILGITMASFSSGLGELTFLQLTHFYNKEMAIGGFSSGTGGAGLLGSFLFMTFTNVLGVPVWAVLFFFSLAPFGFLVSFYGILPKPSMMDELGAYESLDTEENAAEQPASHSIESLKSHVVRTIYEIVPLLQPYMLPLSSVYVCEYVINQGISPTLLFPIDTLPSWLFTSYRDIYVVYGFLYQLGVFVSRSSVNFGIRLRKLYWLSVLQLVNVVLTLFQSWYDLPFTSIWPLLILMFYEGLLGGFSYINTFLSVSEDVPKSKREFCMGCVSMSDSLGVVTAGCINWWLEKHLCNLQVERGRDWCLKGGGD